MTQVIKALSCQMFPWPCCVQGFLLLEHHTKYVLLCAKTRFHLKRPSFHKWETEAHSKLGCSGPGGDLKISTKQVSVSRLLATYILIRDGTPAPVWVFSGKQP